MYNGCKPLKGDDAIAREMEKDAKQRIKDSEKLNREKL